MGLLQILLWPLKLVWFFVTFIFGLIGRIVTLILGALCLILGLLLTMSIACAFLGIPLCILGLLLILRALWIF